MVKPKKTTSTAKSPLTKAELASIDPGGPRAILVGGDDLSSRQPAAEGAPDARACEAALARPLGREPGAVVLWAHFNRVIKRDDLDVIFIAGPGHGAPGVLGPSYLDGTYTEIYPDKSEDVEGMQKLFKQFSFPGHIGSHVTPETPGSIHEGGELATAFRMPTEPRSTIPSSSSRASSAMVRPRPGRSRPRGTRTNSSTPRATARSSRF